MTKPLRASPPASVDPTILFRTREDLTHQDLDDLFERRVSLIVLPAFAAHEWVSAAASRIAQTQVGSFRNGAQFRRIGRAYIEVEDEAQRREYHDRALRDIDQVRALFEPFPSPIDTLRAVVEERWRYGAELLRIGGDPFFAGICRVQLPGVDLEPHTDRLERNLGPNAELTLDAQLSCNIYVQMPRTGGELEIWHRYPDEDEYAALRGDRRFGVDRDRLPPPDITIKPATGDLFILNPRVLHAVRPVEGEPRTTLGLFLGRTGPHAPLSYWS